MTQVLGGFLSVPKTLKIDSCISKVISKVSNVEGFAGV
jgi:hypothetical protein